jgi:2-polyprenyl-3-methyl-5-hydroxy-6-metoxy-1,4-benzoquinol methylase
MIAVLLPRFDHPAIEERYASWQAELLLRAQSDEVHYYEDDDSAASLASGIDAELVLVITDPLLLVSPRLLSRIAAALGDAEAVLPITNESAESRQQRAPSDAYLTLRELEREMRTVEAQPPATVRIPWGDADPAAFLCRTEWLERIDVPPRKALRGRDVAISTNDYVHRWTSMRGQVRHDLLDRIGTNARSVLEFGCGEAPLGAALKARQRCRVVGVELDRAAAAIARRRIDDVYSGDVREIIGILKEQFDWIVGGDILEHLDDPWSFLAELRHVSTAGGHLLLSVPNLANASVVADLLQGRFDYVYMGLTCAGHLRFFTRKSIEEMLAIAGWTAVEITPQVLAASGEATELMERLAAANIPFSREDLTASGYYVVARNDVARDR